MVYNKILKPKNDKEPEKAPKSEEKPKKKK
jgi:hypothetical protein